MTDRAGAAIVAKDLTYRYGTNTAVDGISFEVGHGEILGFLGPNGAGKSTTVKMLTGQLKPAQGHVHLLGMDVAQHTNKVQGMIGVSFETTNLYEKMSAVENLTLFARLFGVRDFDANALLDQVGLVARGKDRVSTYSKGMKQRLMLARALVNSPRVLFLDEPTDGLDPASAQTVHEMIRQAADDGVTVFLTTHDMAEADTLANRVAFIMEGRIVALDRPAVLKRQHGKRALKVELETADGGTEVREVTLDTADAPDAVARLLAAGNVLTVHSEEATLADVFVDITGRGLHG